MVLIAICGAIILKLWFCLYPFTVFYIPVTASVWVVSESAWSSQSVDE